MGKEPSELQKALKDYLDKNPGKERELAEYFSTAVGTITRWVNGHSVPASPTAEAIIKYLNKKST